MGNKCPQNRLCQRENKLNPNIYSRFLNFYSIYSMNDTESLLGMPMNKPVCTLRTLDELLERDKQREKDGFPKKIRIGQIVKPGKGKKNKVVIVPVTTEEKFYHDSRRASQKFGTGGKGDEKEGEVIGEAPIPPQEGEGTGAGEGSGGEHGMGIDAYELGKILTDRFKLPNLQDKGKKRSLTKFVYDLTDKNIRTGQILDKKATLKKIVETNIILGRVSQNEQINPSKLIVNPDDLIYRILSRERDYEAEAVVFFLRDYSGSMYGLPTEAVVKQHLFIYSWLMYQYENNVTSRFILHDTNAKEVPDFYTYYNSHVAGGTKISSAYKLVNDIVEKENLARDYNIYVFHGTDGDDWGGDEKEAISEVNKILSYSNRFGITVIRYSSSKSEFEGYIRKSGLLKKKSSLIKMDVMMQSQASEERLIRGIRRLIS
ncbi:DUF444 family protein [Candidatus Pacearchaeota archaeon]|nr:DUF444 family protein [Candidatus Pacearchaeota archaeon]